MNNFQDYNIPVLDNGVRLPNFQIEARHLDEMGLDETATPDQFLLALTLKGLHDKVGTNHPKYREYYKQAKYELGVFAELGFTEYVLIIWDIMRYCDENGIAKGPGRGSSASCLVFYFIGITKIDSLKYNLYFERFLSKARAKVKIVDGVRFYDGSLILDADLDLSHSERHKVIQYLEEKYSGRICKTLTINTYSTKILLKEACKARLDMSDADAAGISDLIPKIHGFVSKIKDSISQSDDFAKFAKENDNIISICNKLYLLNRFSGTHPSAWCITYDDINNVFPLQRDSDGNIVSAYAMDDSVNLAIKCDLLGLRSAALVDRVCKIVGISPDSIDVNDGFIYQNLQDLHYAHGIFQIESSTNFQVARDVKPKNLDDLSAVLAIARPGALAFAKDYSSFSNSGVAASIHPFFDDVLTRTGGLCIYQEQIIGLLVKIGFTKDEAEYARRIIGKKKTDQVAEWQQKIKDKVALNKLDPAISDVLFKILNDAASYSFNACLGPNVLVTLDGYIPCPISRVKKGDFVLSYDTRSRHPRYVKVKKVHVNHNIELFYVGIGGLGHDFEIQASMDHKFLTKRGMVPLKDVIDNGDWVITRSGNFPVVSYKPIGRQTTYDLEVDSDDHNFYANGIVVSNSHSYAYATLSAQTIYLKYKYPKEFFLVLLMLAKDEPNPTEEIQKIQDELRHFGIKLLGPNISKSDLEFSIDGNDIRFGLKYIKGVSDKTIEKLIKFRQQFNNKFEIFTSAKDVGLNIGVLAALIQAGAMDDYLTGTRSRTVLEAQLWGILTDKERKYCLTYGAEYNYDLLKLAIDLNEKLKDVKGNPLMKDSRRETLRRNFAEYQDIYRLNSKNEALASYFYETKLLGYSYSQNLTKIYEAKSEDLIQISELKDARLNSDVKICGQLVEVFEGKSRKGTKYVKLNVKDTSGAATVLLFETDRSPRITEMEDMNAGKFEEDQIVIVRGKKKEDAIFADLVAIQDAKIYTKLGDLRKKDVDKDEKKD